MQTIITQMLLSLSRWHQIKYTMYTENRKTQEDETLVSLKYRCKMQAWINPFGIIHTRIMHKIQFCSSFNCLAGIYLFKVNDGNARTICETRSKLTMLTLNIFVYCSGNSTVDFEQLNAAWVWVDFKQWPNLCISQFT